MNTLRWAPFPGADVAGYKVYRSMLGFKGLIVSPTAASGLTLQLKMNGGGSQIITFDGTTPVIDKINASLVGGRAYPSIASPAYFFVRSDIRTAPGSIQITGGTALAPMGITPRAIYEKSEDDLIATIPANPDPDTLVEYEDPDGVCQDWYAVSSVSSTGAESAKTPYRQPMTYTGEICVLEGIVTNLQGVRIADAEVSATLVKYPQEIHQSPQITLEPVTTLTGSDGRFSLALLQGALVKIEIPIVGFCRNITVPEKPCEFLTDLQVDLDYRYPLDYREG